MNVRRVRDAGMALAIGFGVGSAAIAANNARERHSSELLGEVDFFEYCRNTYGPDRGADAVRLSAGQGGWMCSVQDPLYRRFKIDVDDACSSQYGTDAQGRTSNEDDPNSWRCYST